MSDIVIERIQRIGERGVSLVEQVDVLLDALRDNARKLWGDSDEGRVFDSLVTGRTPEVLGTAVRVDRRPPVLPYPHGGFWQGRC